MQDRRHQSAAPLPVAGTGGRRLRRLVPAAFVVVALGALLARFWNLAAQPGGLYPDEAAEGVFALQILHQPGYHPVFIDADAGNEATFAYAAAVAFHFFGASPFTLRATAAAIGVGGVFAVWLAARRYGLYAALAAMAWSAGSLWLICISRDGLRNILTVAGGAIAVWALLRWGDRPSRMQAFLAGAAVGVGLWIYAPLKLTPLLVLAWLLWMRRTDHDRYLRLRPLLGWLIAGYLVVGAPQLWTAATDFRNYFGRAASVSAVTPGVNAGDSFPIHFLKTIGMFLVTGDPNQRHDVDALPLLGPVLFIPFALGVARAWRRRREHGYSLLLIAFVVYLIPPLLATEGGSPHFLRSLALAPVIAVFIGVGCLEFVEVLVLAAAYWAPSWSPATRFGGGGVCVVALAALGVASANTYITRPVAQRFSDFSFADVQLSLAAAGGPSNVAIIDSYDSWDVQFVDSADPPTIVSPGTKLADPAVYTLIVAATQSDIAHATNAATAARATVAARDPAGAPTVWEVVP